MLQFLDTIGLNHLISLFRQKFSTKEDVMILRNNTDKYILYIDYDEDLKFDTDFIVSGDASSPIIGIGQINSLIIAKS